jgi:hypothetical protein
MSNKVATRRNNKAAATFSAIGVQARMQRTPEERAAQCRAATQARVRKGLPWFGLIVYPASPKAAASLVAFSQVREELEEVQQRAPYKFCRSAIVEQGWDDKLFKVHQLAVPALPTSQTI